MPKLFETFLIFLHRFSVSRLHWTRKESFAFGSFLKTGSSLFCLLTCMCYLLFDASPFQVICIFNIFYCQAFFFTLLMVWKTTPHGASAYLESVSLSEYLFKNLYEIVLEDRHSSTLWGRGKVCFLTRIIIKIMSSSGTSSRLHFLVAFL